MLKETTILIRIQFHVHEVICHDMKKSYVMTYKNEDVPKNEANLMNKVPPPPPIVIIYLATLGSLDSKQNQKSKLAIGIHRLAFFSV